MLHANQRRIVAETRLQEMSNSSVFKVHLNVLRSSADRHCNKNILHNITGAFTDLLRHHKAKPSPEYGSRHSATTRDGYSSHCSLTARHRNEAAACDI